MWNEPPIWHHGFDCWTDILTNSRFYLICNENCPQRWMSLILTVLEIVLLHSAGHILLARAELWMWSTLHKWLEGGMRSAKKDLLWFLRILDQTLDFQQVPGSSHAKYWHWRAPLGASLQRVYSQSLMLHISNWFTGINYSTRLQFSLSLEIVQQTRRTGKFSENIFIKS